MLSKVLVLIAPCMSLAMGILGATGAAERTGEGSCAAENGDVNADGVFDLSDGVTVLGALFLGFPPALPPLCSSGTYSGLPDTGQILCYDADGTIFDCSSEDFPGQDGSHATGCSSQGRFVDHGDGTVSDTCTGLMWQKATADLDGDGEVTHHVPGVDCPDETDWQGALRYCEDLEFAGHGDWRLPSARELESLVDYGRDDPAPSISTIFEAENSSVRSSCWTSTTLAVDPGVACIVAFWSCDHLSLENKSKALHVRAVRSGCSSRNGDANADGSFDVSDAITILGNLFLGKPSRLVPLCNLPAQAGLPDTGQTTCFDAVGSVIECVSDVCGGQDGLYGTGCPMTGRFADNGDGTVSDTCTGLMWQKATADLDGDGEVTHHVPGVDGPDVTDWQGALRYCEDLEFAGHGDWRLPGVRELESLVDYGRVDPCIDPVFETDSWRYWSSTTLVRAAGDSFGPESAWRVTFLYGSWVYHDDKSDRFYVRAVRTIR